ncbi:MAG: GIY-YIG nuclease family protein [Ignavibacteria bacterium]|nr:GIY-YIG nuclease family protein [Ignavibacteria bacterium]MBI3765315.1 GIY-YIG nuclease family protein [Ignavibacteriales bacterium]
MFATYILRSRVTQRYYIGHSENVLKRLHEHNSGKVRSTKAYRPWDIVYTEVSETKAEAYKREMEIKSYKGGEAFKKLIFSEGCQSG